jgi:ABC-type multidrug transport system fused ATPase/permease subunit
LKERNYGVGELLRRFAPYYKKYLGVLVLDLFFSALSTVCELVLPMIMRYITNTGLTDLQALSVGVILRLGVLYLVLRIIDSCANFYRADQGHVMAPAWRRICAGMPMPIFSSCPTPITATLRWGRSWAASPMTCLM